MNNIIITGTSGFIGGELLTKFNELGIGCYVLKYSKTESAKTKNNPEPNQNVVINWDQFLEWQVPTENYWVIFHCGGASDYRSKNKNYLYEANVVRTKQILDKFNNPKNLLIFMSTIGVYDRPNFATSKERINLKSELSPKSLYGKSKILAEAEITKSLISYRILRLGWIYGEKMRNASHIRLMYAWNQKKKLVSKIEWPGKVSVGYIENLIENLIQMYSEFDGRTQKMIINYADKNPANFTDILTNFDNKATLKIPAWSRYFTRIFPSKMRILLEPQYLVYEDPMGNEVNFDQTFLKCKKRWK